MWIVKKEKDGKTLYYRDLAHASHFTENRNESEKFKNIGLAQWAARSISGTIEEINFFRKPKQ